MTRWDSFWQLDVMSITWMLVNGWIHFYGRILTFLFKVEPIIATYVAMVTSIPRFIIRFVGFLTVNQNREIISNHFFFLKLPSFKLLFSFIKKIIFILISIKFISNFSSLFRLVLEHFAKVHERILYFSSTY